MNVVAPMPGAIRVSERDALEELLTSSEEFREFYSGVRPMIVEPIMWVHDPSLPPGIQFRVGGDETSSVLQFAPTRIEGLHAVHVAHELMHVLDHETGFPSAGTSGARATDTCCALNSMLQDPLIDRRLKGLGFDVRRPFEEEESASAEALQFEAEPSDPLRLAHWTFNRLGDELDWEYAAREPGEPDRTAFIEWFDERFPTVRENAAAVRRLVDSVGFERPDSMAEVLSFCIDRFGLDGRVRKPDLGA